jgi:hypothetical protein
LLDLLLNYVEEYKIEKTLESECKKLNVSFFMLEGVVTDGVQTWSNITGKDRVKLMKGFINGGLAKVCLVENRKQYIIVSNETNREALELIHSKFYKIMLESFKDLKDIRHFLKGKNEGIIQNRDDFEKICSHLSKILVTEFAEAVSNGWYLHVCKGHFSSILKEHGSIYEYSMSALERKNGNHSRFISNATLLSKSSEQLMMKELRIIYFTFIEEKDLKLKPHKYKKRIEKVTSEPHYRRTLSLDEVVKSHTYIRKRKRIKAQSI